MNQESKQQENLLGKNQSEELSPYVKIGQDENKLPIIEVDFNTDEELIELVNLTNIIMNGLLSDLIYEQLIESYPEKLDLIMSCIEESDNNLDKIEQITNSPIIKPSQAFSKYRKV